MLKSFASLLLLWTCLLGVLPGSSLGQQYRGGHRYPSSTRLFGVSYSPFALNSENMCLPVDQVKADLRIIRRIADHIRLYNVGECPEVTETVMRFAKRNGIRIILGLFLSGNPDSNEREMEASQLVIERYGSIIDAIVVGNEVLFSKIVTLDDLIAYITRMKEFVSTTGFRVPVSTGEVWPVYESSIGQRLVAATDFLCMNMQPYWEGWDVFCPPDLGRGCSPAGQYVHAKAEGLEGFFGKPVWICESGWPTEGERCCQGRDHARDGLLAGPSEANATVFINDIVMEGRAVGRPTYVHTVFDDDWKRIWAPCGTCEGLSTLLEDPSCTTCELDYHFGVYTSSRAKKSGVLLPPVPAA